MDKGKSKARIVGWLIFAVVVLVVLLISSIGPYCDYLWYKEDARYPLVFTLQYTIRGLLFVPSFIFAWLVFWNAFKPISKFVAVYSDEPTATAKPLMPILFMLEKIGGDLRRIAPIILAVLFGLSFASNWQDYLVAIHGASFHKVDPVFGYDLSLYVFKIPFLESVFGFALGVVILGGLIAVGFDQLVKFLSTATGAQIALKTKTNFQRWGSLLLVIIAALTELGALSSLSDPGLMFVGPGYAGILQIKMMQVLALLFFIAAIVLLPRTLKVKNLIIIGAVPILWGLVLVEAVPAIVQKVHVDPDKINVENPFALRAIDATRTAFDLNNIQVSEEDVTLHPTPTEVSSSPSTFANMRLWDPSVLQDAVEATQSLRPYYTFNDVDVDRYWLPDSSGRLSEKMLMVSPRDIRTSGLTGSAQNWVNTRLGYTHGYGMIAAEVNNATPDGQPVLLSHDIPIVSQPGLSETEPRIYFSHFDSADSDPGDNSHYVLVDTKVDEFDYPTEQGAASNRWSGNRGISLGNMFRKLLFGFQLGDTNLVISPNITGRSKLLLHRDILDRAQRLYPFLSFDPDPYIANINGHLEWFLDGYTVSDRYPYSQLIDTSDGSVNYIRNSVKVVIDANSGDMQAFAVDPSDPILQTYRSIYPGLIQNKSLASAAIQAHFRYPEQLFSLQTEALTQYHVTDPTTFLNNGDAWSIANERDLSGEKAPIPPYYVLTRLPDEVTDEFMLIRPFTPYHRDNMTGWIAAHCDGSQYGKLTLYRFPKGATVQGPAQEENLFVQDKTIADINRNYNNDQSRIIVGNLLVIPVGKSLVYAESLFIQSTTNGTQALPELRKVILATQDKIEVADTYQEALSGLLGASAGSNNSISSPAVTNQPAKVGRAPQNNGSVGTVSKADVERALKILQQADAALKNGDFAKYGTLQRQVREQLKGLLQSNNRGNSTP